MICDFCNQGVGSDVRTYPVEPWCEGAGPGSATDKSGLSGASDKPAPEAKDHEFDEEILDALRSARKGLTEDGIGAVIALRREISIDTALEQLLLEGAIDACMADKNGALIVSNFRFCALKSEDTSADQMPADNGGTIVE